MPSRSRKVSDSCMRSLGQPLGCVESDSLVMYWIFSDGGVHHLLLPVSSSLSALGDRLQRPDRSSSSLRSPPLESSPSSRHPLTEANPIRLGKLIGDQHFQHQSHSGRLPLRPAERERSVQRLSNVAVLAPICIFFRSLHPSEERTSSHNQDPKQLGLPQMSHEPMPRLRSKSRHGAGNTRHDSRRRAGLAVRCQAGPTFPWDAENRPYKTFHPPPPLGHLL